MKRLIVAAAALALAVPLAGCGPEAPPASPGSRPTPIAAASAKLAQVERAYAGAKAWADLLIPIAAPQRVAQLRAIEAKIEAALAAARAASTIAQQLEQLARAEAAIAQLATPY